MTKKILLFLLFCSITVIAQKNKKEILPFQSELLENFPMVRDFSMSTAGDEVYVSIQSYLGELSGIVRMNKVDNRWSKPQIANFSGQFNDLEPFLSPDGLALYFASNRPNGQNGTEPKDYDIWVVTRTSPSAAWSAPFPLGPEINTKKNEFYPAITNSKNLYFTSDRNDITKDDIFVSMFKDHKYQTPVSLSKQINSNGYEFNAYVSPDESLILYSGYNRPDGQGNGDLYLSFKDDKNQWRPAVNLGSEINSKEMDFCPYYDSTSQTLFFTSRRSIIKTHFNHKMNLSEFMKEMDLVENGQSKIYQITIDLQKFNNAE